MNSEIQRVNITLPHQTLKRIDQITERGDRSRFIDMAVNFYFGHRKRTELRKLLQEGAVARAGRDRDFAADLFLDDVWDKRR